MTDAGFRRVARSDEVDLARLRPVPGRPAGRRDRDWRGRVADGWSLVAEKLFALPPERLIRFGRFTFSAFALLAIWLDPTQPARNVEETYTVLIAYIVYGALLAVLPAREALNARVHYVTHTLDIIALSTLCILTGELSSPFWAFVGFMLIASAMRWGFTGALVTALILICLFTAIGWPYYDPSNSDLNGLIMRSTYALVAAVMLGYFASYRERSRRRLAHLAAWPIEATAKEGEPWLEGSLRHASEVIGGVELLVMWNDSEEPNGRIAHWDGSHCTFLDVADDGGFALGGSPSADFLYGTLADLGFPQPVLNRLRLDRVHVSPKKPVCCTVHFETSRYKGQILVIDPGYPNDDTLSLTEIVAGRIAFELEQFALLQELSSAAGWRERGRLARDLHDSVLQDLTAAGVQLKIVSQQVPGAAQGTLGLIGKLLQEQQRRIRSFVENARQTDAGPQQFKSRLEAFLQPLSRQWNCIFSLEVTPSGLTISDQMLAAIFQIVSEATANAVRHGEANHLKLAARGNGSALELRISDNGSGMTDVQPIGETRPQSLRARVADLAGEFELCPSLQGLSIRISLPH